MFFLLNFQIFAKKSYKKAEKSRIYHSFIYICIQKY